MKSNELTKQECRKIGRWTKIECIKEGLSWRLLEAPGGLRKVTVEEFEAQKDKDGRINGFCMDEVC